MPIAEEFDLGDAAKECIGAACSATEQVDAAGGGGEGKGRSVAMHAFHFLMTPVYFIHGYCGTVLTVLIFLILIVGSIVLYVMWKGLQKIKAKPLDKIPIPPTNNFLGHTLAMASSVKHLGRLNISESANAPVHQLVIVKHASVFVNDAEEVVRVLNEVPCKGALYNGFRFDGRLPDILASDGADHNVRSKALGLALTSIRAADEERITRDLLKVLNDRAEDGKPLDIAALFTLLAFDCVSAALFNYELGAVAGSEEGKNLRLALETLAIKQTSQGLQGLMAADPNVRKISAEEEQEAKDRWGSYVKKMNDVVTTEALAYKNSHNGELDVESNFGHALLALSENHDAAPEKFKGYLAPDADPENAVKFKKAIMNNEIHQMFRHGHEAIAGMLSWIFVALHRNPSVRTALETSIVNHNATAQEPYPEYLECIIKETLRRYPVCGNMTVRTIDQDNYILKGGYPVPKDTPIHLHIFTLQNSTREWKDPQKYLPERWLDSAPAPVESEDTSKRRKSAGGDQEERPSYPRCPFLAKKASERTSGGIYDGVGHTEGSLSFFPFSTGSRTCLGKNFALQILRRVLFDVASNYRLHAYEEYPDEDVGSSEFATIVPMLKHSTNVLVTRATNLGASEKEVKKEVKALAPKADEGWADDDDDDKVPDRLDD